MARQAYLDTSSFAIIVAYPIGVRFAIGGGSKIKLTRRLPQRGHIIRSQRPESDMLRPRVQANVSRLSSAFGPRPSVINRAVQTARMHTPFSRFAQDLHLHENKLRTSSGVVKL